MSVPEQNMKTIIFTDLDGTLLDHDTYSFDAALEMLHYLKRHAIPLVIVTSKTAAEVQELLLSLDLQTPAIIENGAGIIQNSYVTAFGKTYEEIRTTFTSYAKEFELRGFFDMSIEEVIRLTGLPPKQAQDAKKRLFTEPFIMKEPADLSRLQELAAADGLAVIQGGRFYHLITKGQDKAAAIARVKQMYEAKDAEKYTALALGDGANDISMLKCADRAFLIPKTDGSYLECEISGLIKAPYPGPKGWNTVLKEYFHVS